jgi:hypothetical protein
MYFKMENRCCQATYKARTGNKRGYLPLGVVELWLGISWDEATAPVTLTESNTSRNGGHFLKKIPECADLIALTG